MELKQDPRCYTDVCVDGYWYHYDHCSTRAYVLKGGSSPELTLSKEPKTESELISLLRDISK
ncbi:hypothetical protein [Vibrio sp. 10N.261.55.A7]|uniref:hypothetical protein n=1 Tax=Vibrio TaxID=662 RepID=UPI000C8614DC|nr:hypothetical protein [Vibrio sp. 10N.261.55.A7]PMJ88750.1 hypothetical protein BCU12_14800 [Vibrio sp. 10N.261.55.A7]